MLRVVDISLSLGITFLCVVTIRYIFNHFYMNWSYKNTIKRKQYQLRQRKKDLHDKLSTFNKTPNEIEKIINMTVNDLLSEIESGFLKPLDILKAYQIKALEMDQEYNFITDFNPNAEKDASDSIKSNGLLKGIPISVKDVFCIKDCDCTYGMPSFCFKPAIQDSTIVQALRLQGAVPFVMTNMCQTGISMESSNPIFGQTLNPNNKQMTSGGSSGGEGAILSAGASILGIGSDIGGSIRIPSSFCGIFGLKPTSDRISRRHTVVLYPDQNLINVSIGPMARRFDDLLILFKAMVSDHHNNLDPNCPPLGFNDRLYQTTKPQRIGYYSHLGGSQVQPVPAVVRAIQLAKASLESAGHTLVEFTVPDVDDAMFGLYLKCLFTDGGHGFVDKFLNDNPVDSSLSVTVLLLKIPNWLKKLLSYVLYPFNKNYSNGLFALVRVPSVYSLWQLKDRLDEYKETFLSQWQRLALDGVIGPVMPVTAPPCQSTKYIMDVVTYTAIYNVLDWPAGSVPVTRVVESDIDQLLTSYPRDTPTHRQIVELQRDSVNMPVGVQVVTAPWREELCLRIMADLHRHLQS